MGVFLPQVMIEGLYQPFPGGRLKGFYNLILNRRDNRQNHPRSSWIIGGSVTFGKGDAVSGICVGFNAAEAELTNKNTPIPTQTTIAISTVNIRIFIPPPFMVG